MVLVVDVEDLAGGGGCQIGARPSGKHLCGGRVFTYDIAIALELCGEVLPEGAKGGRVCDDCTVVSSVVVGVEDGKLALPGDVSHDAGQVLEIPAVQLCCYAPSCHPLEQKWDSEDVVALADQSLINIPSQQMCNYVTLA